MEDRSGIINLEQVRNKKMEEKRRRTERLFFRQLIGIYGLTSGNKMVPVELVDVSEDGLGFQLPYREESKWPIEMENQKIRLYFSAESYMEVNVDIRNSRPVIEDGERLVHYGCSVQAEQRAFAAWKQFVYFLRAYAEVSQRDTGNIGVSGF